MDGIEMFGALGQYQYLSTLAIGVFDLGGNRVRSGLVGGKVTEYILNPRLLRQINPRVECTRRHSQIVRRTRGLSGGVVGWPALHKNNRLLAIVSNRCGAHAQIARTSQTTNSRSASGRILGASKGSSSRLAIRIS